MSKDLIFKIRNIQNNKNSKDILEILNTFDSIINKYSRKLNGEDTKQDLYVFLINLIHNINYNSIVNYEDKQLLSYLSKSLKNEYIRLSKKNDKQKNNEYYNCEDKELGFNLIESNIETLDIIDTLNDYEKNIIKLIIINGYSPAEIAKKMGKSRQAINQAKIRALNKLKNFI